MTNPLMVGVASWFLPGAGYWMTGRKQRAIVIAAVVWAMFIVAVLGKGLYYPGFSFNEGALLYLLNIFARAGNGLGLVVGWFYVSAVPAADAAAKATFEYGGRFLEVAGLINFLAALDAVDITLGRKE